MRDRPDPAADLVRLPESERRLVQGVLDGSAVFGSTAELEQSRARLRNLKEKYRDRLKRRRVEARAGLPVESVETLRAWLAAIERAERAVRERLGMDQ